MHTDTEIISQMINYLTDVIEKPHPNFGGMPICPFSGKSRTTRKILYKVHKFSNSELEQKSDFMQSVYEFSQDNQHEILLVIHPELTAFSVEEMHHFTNKINLRISALGLLAFDGHPDDDFNIQGVYTRKAPYIHLTVQSKQRVKEASDALLKTPYYVHWSSENLQYVGMPRD